MCKFFPYPQIINVNPDVELIAFQCEDTVLQLASVAAGATFELHQHPESQIGMLFSGSLEMNIDGIKEFLEPLDQVYVAAANVLHGSINPFSEPALGFDIKRVITSEISSGKTDKAFLKVSPTSDEATGLACQSVVGSWFEVAITQIPPGEKIPIHKSQSEQMGIIVNGELIMTVGEEHEILRYGQIYYTPPNVLYGGYNYSTETVSLIEILIPPRVSGEERA
ncbi:cupin domain-containing protein [Limnofasciculus baicalensis]|uniref:Cupin domain-containing protein n=1 Tax=Limnofasciculus baicalensis BBK-W-15 TaxID=2699891 RepID=A0AAE3GPQ6_9CYAN|nr:cupin domain-containing protein [Limnofasciculus baicalensis]MCP2727563.1 cupin domain-containing protein [Limnofasciculus baicalensis BBK-W-15]